MQKVLDKAEVVGTSDELVNQVVDFAARYDVAPLVRIPVKPDTRSGVSGRWCEHSVNGHYKNRHKGVRTFFWTN